MRLGEAVQGLPVSPRARIGLGDAPEPSVLVFADGDDTGISRLVECLRSQTSVVWWKFGEPDVGVSVDVDVDDVWLEQPGAIVTSGDFARARVIIYRRRFHFPRPLVLSSLSAEADRSFAEREWSSLIDAILIREEQRSQAVWLNSPSASLRCNNKLSLMLRAADWGLLMAPFRVSAPVRLPPDAPGGIVTKAISTDERIDASRYLTTALVPPATLEEINGTHLGTPCLLQHRIYPQSELRIFQILGETLAVTLRPSSDHIDIRYSSPREMAPRLAAVSPELGSALADFVTSQQLRFCAFDVLVTDDNRFFLVDVTPNGSWDYFEDAEAPVISEALARAVAKYLVAQQEPGSVQ